MLKVVDRHIISEEVSGKCINICHIISNPDVRVTQQLSLEVSPFAIVSVSPGEAAIAVADYLSKSGSLDVMFIDRYLGTVLVTGSIGTLETTCKSLLRWLHEKMAFARAELTQS